MSEQYGLIFILFWFLPQVEDSAEILADKTQELADAISQARHLVVYTGAGVSTVRFKESFY